MDCVRQPFMASYVFPAGSAGHNKRLTRIFPLAGRLEGWIQIQASSQNGAAVIRVGDMSLTAGNCAVELFAGQAWPPFQAPMDLKDLHIQSDTDGAIINVTIGFLPNRALPSYQELTGQ